MKKIVFLLGIICLFVFMGCGQEEKTERQFEETTSQTVEDLKERDEKTTELSETAEETAESGKEESRQAAEAEETVEIVEGKPGETATSDFPEVIEMKNEKAFPQHRMGIVYFDHEKHAADKPKGYGSGCGECHHDENGEPLRNLTRGDEVQSCYECHDKAGIPRRDPAISKEDWKEEQLKYYYGAIHGNCTECHKKTGGPVSCTECHPRPQK